MPLRAPIVALLLLFAAIVLNAPHLLLGVGDANFDLFLHYNWARDFALSLDAGQFYPRWVYHARFDLGEPTFLFYSPLYFFAVAGLKPFGLDTWSAMQWVEVLSNAGFAGFVYRLASHYTRPTLALLIALAALFNPFLVMLHYKWQGFPWASVGHLALGGLLWALLRPRPAAASPWRFDVPTAFALALAILAHIVSAMATIIVLSGVLLGIAVWRWRRDRTTLSVAFAPFAQWLLAVAVAVLLAAFYLLPAVLNKDVLDTGAAWDLSTTLEGFSVPLVTQFTHGIQWFLIQWPISVMAFALLGVALLYWYRVPSAPHDPSRIDAPVALLLGGAAVAALLASELSYPLWRVNTPLRYVVVPYRFDFLVFVFTLLALGLAAEHAGRTGRAASRYGLIGLLALTAAGGLALLAESTLIAGDPLPRALLADEFTSAPYRDCLLADGPAAAPTRFKACADQARRSGPYRGVSEYRLPWARDGHAVIGLDWRGRECTPHGIACADGKRTADGMRWALRLPEARALSLPIMDFPMWVASIDGRDAPHRAAPDSGLVQLDVPAGAHAVAVHWRASAVERIGRGLSLLGLGLSALGAYAARRRATAG